MSNTNPITTSRIMDLITRAVRLHLARHADAISLVWDSMTPAERLGFDLFLVRMRHVMATEAGSTEWRFREVVLRHAELSGVAPALTPEELKWAQEARAWVDADKKDLDRRGPGAYI